MCGNSKTHQNSLIVVLLAHNFGGQLAPDRVDSAAMMRTLEQCVAHISRVNSWGSIVRRFRPSEPCRATQCPLPFSLSISLSRSPSLGTNRRQSLPRPGCDESKKPPAMLVNRSSRSGMNGGASAVVCHYNCRTFPH